MERVEARGEEREGHINIGQAKRELQDDQGSRWMRDDDPKGVCRKWQRGGNKPIMKLNNSESVTGITMLNKLLCEKRRGDEGRGCIYPRIDVSYTARGPRNAHAISNACTPAYPRGPSATSPAMRGEQHDKVNC